MTYNALTGNGSDDSDHDYNGNDGRMEMQFTPLCIKDINVRLMMLEFKEVGTDCGCTEIINTCGSNQEFCDCNCNISDCTGLCGGTAIIDVCGSCNGNGSSCETQNNLIKDFEKSTSLLSLSPVLKKLSVDVYILNNRDCINCDNFPEINIIGNLFDDDENKKISNTN